MPEQVQQVMPNALATAQVLAKFKEKEDNPNENKPVKLTNWDIADVFVRNSGRLETMIQSVIWDIKNPTQPQTEDKKPEFFETSGLMIDAWSKSGSILLVLQKYLFNRAPITKQQFVDLIKGGNVKDLLDEGDLAIPKKEETTPKP